MGFWSDAGEPLRQYRWYMVFGAQPSANAGLAGQRAAAAATIPAGTADQAAGAIRDAANAAATARAVQGGGGGGLDDVRYALKKVDKPKAKIAEVTHKYLNHFFYYPGRLEWESVNLTIAASLKPSVDDKLYNALTDAGYVYPTDYNTDQTISKKKFGGAIGSSIYIIQIDSNGSPIEEWELKNPFFTSVQFGTLDYGSEEIVEISTTIRYDTAIFRNVGGDLDS